MVMGCEYSFFSNFLNLLKKFTVYETILPDNDWIFSYVEFEIPTRRCLEGQSLGWDFGPCTDDEIIHMVFTVEYNI